MEAQARSNTVPELDAWGAVLGHESMVNRRHRDRDYGLRRVLLSADWLGLLIAFTAALVIAGDRPAPIEQALWILPMLPFWALLFRAYGLYQRPLRRPEPTHLDDISSLFHAMIIGTLGLWVFYKALSVPRLDLQEVALFGAFALILIGMLRANVRMVSLRIRGPERVLVAAAPEEVRTLQRKLGNHPEYEMRVVAALPLGSEVANGLDMDLCSDLGQIGPKLASGEVDHLLVDMSSPEISQQQMAELMRTCFRVGVRFGIFSRETSLLYPGVQVNHVEGTGFLSYHPPVLSRSSRILKRSMDLLVAGGLLVLFAIPMAIVALAIRFQDGGSVFYRQTRVGKDGRRFRLIKFRSMEVGADNRVGELMAHSLDPDWLNMDEDPRVTRVGRFLRKSSLDELPQLWNVLVGDMSMVGPRPLPERDDAAVRGWGRHRLDCTPGLTGYWQVLGRNKIPFREMVEIDHAYVTSWSIWQDVKLLARTVPVVLRRRGAN